MPLLVSVPAICVRLPPSTLLKTRAVEVGWMKFTDSWRAMSKLVKLMMVLLAAVMAVLDPLRTTVADPLTTRSPSGPAHAGAHRAIMADEAAMPCMRTLRVPVRRETNRMCNSSNRSKPTTVKSDL